MPETNKTTPKGIQISKIAKEVNRQSGEILDYLKRIGVEVGGIMSKVDESVYGKILGHFKSDVEEVEKHKQKLIEFKKKHKGVEIVEIQDEVNKEKEKKQKEEEEHRLRLEEEQKIKAERENQLQKELDEKKKLIELKKVEIEKDKEYTEHKKTEEEPVKITTKEITKTPEKTEEIKPGTLGKTGIERKEPIKPRKSEPKPPFDKDKKKEPYKGKEPFKAREPFKPKEPFNKSKEPFNKSKEPFKPPFVKPKEKFERKFERVTIQEDFRKKKPAPGQRPGGPRPPFKKPFGAKDDSRNKSSTTGTTPQTSTESNADIEKRRRDLDKNNKSKKQKYSDGADAKKRQKKFNEEEISQEIEQAIRETMSKIDDVGALTSRSQLRKKKKKERIEQEAKEQQEFLAKQNILQVTEYLSTSELASLMAIEVNQIIQKSLELGLMITINQRLDRDLIVLLADEYGFKVDFHKEYEVDLLADKDDAPDTLVFRPPVVTIMGHVDHGKTSLLDYIRKANVVAGEAGGITQHIGAYQVQVENGKLISFLDTPGHEAFTAMRARGAQITDIVVLVVAADDSVMPQTVEAINHALAANVPIIVAINKIDKPNADPTKIKTQLSDRGILVEEWGGKYQHVEIAAKTGLNVDQLLEKILLEAEVLDLKANPDRDARGTIIEAKLDKGKGATATVLVQKGTLNVGDTFVAGVYSGKVKAMYDERGHKIFSVKPATPVQVLGFDGMPQAGDILVALDSEKDTKEISLKRQQLKREQDFRQVKFITLDDISKQIKEGKQVDLNVIIKGDVDGSVEALSDSLLKLGTNEVKVSVIHKGIGEISENDVLLASASKAIIVGFNVRPSLKARKLSESEKVDIRLHSIIYDVINEIKLALEGLLEPDKSEEILATVEVRDTFKVPKIGTIAGCYVLDGKVVRNNKVRLLREGLVIFNGSILALKRFKDDVREVEAGFECGISLENFNDIKVSDIIESYTIVETKRKLEQ